MFKHALTITFSFLARCVSGQPDQSIGLYSDDCGDTSAKSNELDKGWHRANF
ncbi:hypothetical protein PGT21_031064 [Puccinia graminis f. sp. tritici]|uniref:Uncharacterized protein n=1 Tax=Puccinia graminis f. sp. tritici TaxID=56615 RepID=A0A5B0M8H1_PUCGR|nr:hypothetical protein PGT21_031064 [Puccinia graminis f. sp. tritici]